MTTVVYEDFEDASLAVTVNSGDWARSTLSGAHDGTYVYRSAGITHGETSQVHIAVPSGATICSFWYKVSSEEGYDFFDAYLDDSTHIVTDASGEVGWTLVFVDCTGSSTLDLYYAKDAAVSSGSDAAYIDSLYFADGIGPGALRHYLYLDGAWRDITGDVRASRPTVISRGRSRITDTIGIDTCTFTIDNTSGDYSQTNPTGTWYGYLGQNVPHRCCVLGANRFHGEISFSGLTWDLSGGDITGDLVSSSILRRLTQGDKQAQSVYTAAAVAQLGEFANMVAYWPMEDAASADLDFLSSGLASGAGLRIDGTPSLAAEDGFYGSKALPTLTSGAAFAGAVRSYTSTNEIQLIFMLRIATAVGSQSRLMSLLTTGSAYRWELWLETDGDLTIRCFDQDYSSLLNSRWNINLDDAYYQIILKIKQNGSDIDWYLQELEQGSDAGTYTSGTVSSQTAGAATWLTYAPDHNLADITVGQTTLQSAVTNTTWPMWQELYAYGGYRSNDADVYETADARLIRLILDATGITCSAQVSNLRMGPQVPGTLMENLEIVERSDGGFIVCDRDSLGLYMISDAATWSGSATTWTLDYSASDPVTFSPTHDDTGLTNRVSARRQLGISATVELAAGQNSTLDPPDGAGEYATSPVISVQFDKYTHAIASRILGAGTVGIGGPRFTELAVQMARPQMSAADYVSAIVSDVGSLLVIANPPSPWYPDDLYQTIIGYHEQITAFTWSIGHSTVPDGIRNVAVIATSTVGSASTTVNGAHDSTTTSLAVTCTHVDGWSHADGDFTINVTGETMTVTAVAGTGPGYTLTVTRSVNGVIKAHSDGETVDVHRPTYIGYDQA